MRLTKEQYEQQVADCDDLCVITPAIIEATDQMQCVRCPFCSEIVNAILTKTHIICPACNESAKL